MKIGKVTCWLLRIPHLLPLAKQQHHTLYNFVEIETDDGIKGHAMALYPLKHGIRDFINREAGAAIEGMDAMRTEEIRTRLLWSTSGKHFHGAWNCAASLIDIALWDVKGQALNQPIWKLLGGARSEVPAYVTFGLSRYRTEELIEVARTLVSDGHTGLKMVVAAGPHFYDDIRRPATDASISEDAARVGALREALGSTIDIIIDANKSASFAQALKLAKACEPYNLTWFEDAVQQGDPRLLARLKKQTTVPLAAGSNGTSDLMYLREYVLRDAVHFLQPNVFDIGGYTQALKAAGIAQAFNVPLMGGHAHLNMHLHAGVLNGGRVEFHLEVWRCFEAVFDRTPTPVNGKVTLPTAPGLGYTPKTGFLDLAVN